MTHAELVERAVRWLRNSAVVYAGYDRPDGRGARARRRCGIALAEPRSSAREIPDAIGWFGGGYYSIVIEAKTTIADFLGDRSKRFRRQPGLGMGRYRYYLTPPRLVDGTYLRDGWGLLECHARRITVPYLAQLQAEYNARAEVELLHAVLRRERERVIGEPVAWLHVLDNTEGLEGNEPIREFTFSPQHPFGIPGEDYSDEFPVTSTPLFVRRPTSK